MIKIKELFSEKFSLVDVFVLSFYFIFTLFLVFGLLGVFNFSLVISSIILCLFFIFVIRKQIVIIPRQLIFFIIVPLVCAGFGFLRGFFIGDAYDLYLPIGRVIAQTGHIPAFYVGQYFSQMPLLSLLFAATFSVFNTFNEFVCLWVPFFFTSATLILLYQWAKEKKMESKFLYFLPLLFLSNWGLAFWGGWNLVQESPLLFFATAFFYYYENYLSTDKKKYLILCLMSFTLAVCSKLSAPFLVFLLLYLFLKSKQKPLFIFYVFVFSLPISFWLLRNYIIFSNPFFPILNAVFKNEYYEIIYKNFNYYHPGPTALRESFFNKIYFLGYYILSAFPLLILSVYGFIKEKRYDFLILVFSFGLIKEIFLFVPTISTPRYYYIFFGLITIYGLFGLQYLKSRLSTAIIFGISVFVLLTTPFFDSGSQFIASFEQRLYILRTMSFFLYSHPILVSLLAIPLMYLMFKKIDSKACLILIYCLYIFHLPFVANKSWINTYPFIIAAFLFIFLLYLSKKFNSYSRQLVAAFVFIAIFINSWGMASAYYYNQGRIELPVSYLFQGSAQFRKALDEKTESTQRQNYYLLVGGQQEYFNWFTDYRAVNFGDTSFWIILRGYNSKFNDVELKTFLIDKKIKYLVKNVESIDTHETLRNEYSRFFDQVKKSGQFQLIYNDADKFFIWQVY